MSWRGSGGAGVYGAIGIQPRVGSRPSRSGYDVVIVGGATSGWSVAWHLVTDPGFDGRVLVVEPDPSWRRAATSASNNCMRQQFATRINVEIAQYAADFVKDFRTRLGGDPAVPELTIRDFGYLYLSDSDAFTEVLRHDQAIQAAAGAGTQILTADQIADRYPFYGLEGIVGGSLNTRDEGAYDAPAMVDWMRRKAIEAGVEHVENRVVAMTVSGERITHVTLDTGDVLAVETVVDAAGNRAVDVARMAGVDLPVEPHRRYTYIVSAEHPLGQDLPLTIDPTGVHLRSYGDHDYLVGCPPIGPDVAVDPDDFSYAEPVWEQKMLPVIRRLLPTLGEVRVTDSWMGHYEFNTFDRNAIVGPHTDRPNLQLIVGFSGHGSQQGPACGRGLAELIAHGRFQTLDLGALTHARIPHDEPLIERAVI